MTMTKTVVGDQATQWQKQTLYKGRELSQDEQKVKQFQEITFQFNNFNDDLRTFEAIASTPVQDRQGDSVLQNGWFVDNFIKNPVIPWAHDYSTPPVARAIEIGINAQGNLQFTYQAPPEGLYELADTIWNLYRNGFMFAFSVGFIPLDYEGDYREGYTFTKAELLEISAVVVPANPQAVALAYKMGDLTDKQAKTLRNKMAMTVKNLEEAMIKNKEKSTEEDSVIEHPVVEEEVIEKGALADALSNDIDWMARWNQLEPVDDIYWTFVDLWFSEATTDDQLIPLMKELANLIMAVANGEYTPPEASDDDSDWDDWEFLGQGLKSGVDKDKVKKLLAAVSKKFNNNKAKGLTTTQKIKENTNMTESQEAALKSVEEKLNAEVEANAEFRKSVLEMLTKSDVKDEDNKVDTEVAEEPVVEKTPAEDEKSPKQDEDVSNHKDDDASKGDQGEVKSAEVSEDGADHKDEKEDDEIDLDNLTDEQQEEYLKAFNDVLEKSEK